MDKYLRGPQDAADPRINLVGANLRGLPKTTIVLAEIDPLRSDGDMLAERLEGVGVSVNKKIYEGVTHDFFGLGAVVSDAKNAVEYVGDQLEDSLKRK
jgi:acetyl esterase/lipase